MTDLIESVSGPFAILLCLVIVGAISAHEGLTELSPTTAGARWLVLASGLVLVLVAAVVARFVVLAQ